MNEPKLFPGSVFGLRSWALLRQGPKMELRGNYGQTWHTGTNTAICIGRYRSHPANVVPKKGCSCGFYMYWGLEQLHDAAADKRVYGVVEGWGRTIIGTKGFRCQYAHIRALCVPGAAWITRRRLGKQWAVPVYASVPAMIASHSLTTEYLQS